jgi:asparagine synthase (glutamine-hydrolysing)
MSGIFGLLRLGGGGATARELGWQARALAHRGRDRSASKLDGPAGLGHLLNRITHEDAFDAQPLTDAAAGVTLAADLRLDNREALAEALGIDGGALASMPDSALLLRAYLRWREDCVDHLLGDFAFAVWDRPRRRLVLARDHLGQRPLCYYQGADVFVFASEARGLFAIPDVPQRLDMTIVGGRFIFDAAPKKGISQFEGVRSVEGGRVLTIDADGTLTTRHYWTPQPAPEHLDRDEAYYVSAYRRVLSEAVACRVRRTARPPALLLGGGFDSGAIAGLAAEALAPQGRKLVAVSSVMPEGDHTTPGNARPWVERIVGHAGNIDIRYVTREGADILTTLTEDFMRTDGTHGPNRYVNGLLFQAARDAGARVVMDGNGGDYTLNPRARRALLRLLLQGRLRRFLKELRAARRATGAGYTRLALRDLVVPLLPSALAQPFQRLRRGLAPFGPAAPIATGFLAEVKAAGYAPAAAQTPLRFVSRRAALTAVLARGQSSGIGGAIHAASYGLDLTMPFLDKRVVELALAIPDDLTFRNGRDRYLARKSLKDILPPEFQTRGSANDDLVPDYPAMIARIAPQILAEIDRMERQGRMGRYYDLPRMRRMLTGDDVPFFKRRTRGAVEHAARAFIHARYVEWFNRGNYSGGDETE